MQFQTPLIKGTLIRRYKRFLADIRLEDGRIVTAHCTNSGSMKSCIEPNAEVYLTPVDDPKRKTRFTWEMITINGSWVGVNTGNPNKIAIEEIRNGKIKGLENYSSVTPEVKYKDSRFDIFAKNEKEECFIEVKNVTLNDSGVAKFPDAITTRGLKHLETLIDAKQHGYRSVMLYIIQRLDVKHFEPAAEIDIRYAETLTKAFKLGVEIIAQQVIVSPKAILLHKQLPIKLL